MENCWLWKVPKESTKMCLLVRDVAYSWNLADSNCIFRSYANHLCLYYDFFLHFKHKYILHKAKTGQGVEPTVHFYTHLWWFNTCWPVTAIEAQLLQKGIERIPKNFEDFELSIKVEYCYYENDNPRVSCLFKQQGSKNSILISLNSGRHQRGNTYVHRASRQELC